MGCFSRPQAPLLPHTMTTGSRCRTSVSASISEKPAAPSPSSRTTCADGPGQPGRDRVAESGAQAAERSRVQPPARPGRLDVLARERDEVAAVPDDHRVVLEHPEQFAVDARRVHRLGLAGQQRAVSRLRGPHGLGEPPAPVLVTGAAQATRASKNALRSPAAEAASGTCPATPPGRVGHVHDLRR